MNLNDMKTRILPTFERMTEPVEVVRKDDSFFDENQVFCDCWIRNDNVIDKTKIIMFDGRVFIKYKFLGEDAKDKEIEEVCSWDYERIYVRRRDLDFTPDYIEKLQENYGSSEEHKFLEFMREDVDDINIEDIDLQKYLENNNVRCNRAMLL